MVQSSYVGDWSTPYSDAVGSTVRSTEGLKLDAVQHRPCGGVKDCTLYSSGEGWYSAPVGGQLSAVVYQSRLACDNMGVWF